MTTSNLKSNGVAVHHETCGACGGARDGRRWRGGKPICASCAAGPSARKAPCPLRCGPGGQFGPACRFGAGHAQPCAPRGSSHAIDVILALQRQRRAEAAHG